MTENEEADADDLASDAETDQTRQKISDNLIVGCRRKSWSGEFFHFRDLIGHLKMTGNNGKLEHTVFCPEECSLRHNEMILALSGNEDHKKPSDLSSLKVALYSHLQNGWNAHCNVPDALPEFRFPLVHWACVLGRTQALNWLLTKLKFKAFVTVERTGETGLHRALRLLHKVRSRDAKPRSVRFICNKFRVIVHKLTEQDPSGLFLKDKVQGNTVFHMCALCISEQESAGRELDYYDNCMKILLQCVNELQTTKKLPSDSLHKAINSQNDRGETVLHILARNNYSFLAVRYILFDHKEIVDRFKKNHEHMTPLDIARDRQANLVQKELDSEGVGIDDLARNHPDLYQLYTQDDDDDAYLCEHQFSRNGQVTLSTNNSGITAQDSSRAYPLRLSSLFQRKGFYCSSSIDLQRSASEDSSSQDEGAQSPSVLDSLSVPSTQSLTTSTENTAACDSQSTVNSDSESASQHNGNEDERGVTVVVDEDLIRMSVQDQGDACFVKELNNCTVPSVTNCDENIVVMDFPSNSNSCSGDVLFSEHGLPVQEREDVQALTGRNAKEESACDALGDCPLFHENNVSSALAKVIRQESDVASMLVARLQDKKERTHVALRAAQRSLVEKQATEMAATNNLQQLKVEMERLSTQNERMKRRREELLAELKGIEESFNHFEKQSLVVQCKVEEEAQVVASLKAEREKANKECVSLKRKFTEYSEALNDICSPCEEPKVKRECFETIDS